ncbi:MAG: hypothetical protein ABGX20_02380 [Bacillus sp. (in: firmicutes)]
MRNLIRTIFHLVMTTLIYTIFNEGAMFSLDHGSLFSITITIISFLAYGPTCYLIARNFEFGRWKYVFFIPFINEILYLIAIYTTPIRTFFPMEDDNYGVGMMILPLTVIMWIIFIVCTFTGIKVRKKSTTTIL